MNSQPQPAKALLEPISDLNQTRVFRATSLTNVDVETVVSEVMYGISSPSVVGISMFFNTISLLVTAQDHNATLYCSIET